MNSTPQHLEVEVKFYLPDPDLIVGRLDHLGAVEQPKVFETNVRFEDDTGSLKKGDCLLRLRQDKNCRLTFKSPPPANNTQCKVYQELEVEVSDFETMASILNALGYQKVQTYEKWRQTFSWRNVLICMDTMPYGDFLEIEGPESEIRKTAQTLGLPWKKRILGNYLAIFETLRKANQLPFKDVTFGNFQQHPVDITPYLAMFEAKGNNDQDL